MHTDVGNMAVGCKINGKIAPLRASPTATRSRSSPRAQIAAGGGGIARHDRQGLRRHPPRHPRRGAQPVCRPRSTHRSGSASGVVYSDEKLQGALPRLARASVDEVMSAVGRGEMRAADVAKRMYPDYKEERAATIAQQPKPESGWFGLKKAISVKARVPGETGAAIPIRSHDLPVRLAPNGGAVPGDRIVGILTLGEGITIYPIQPPALKDFEDVPERWLDLRWDARTPAALSGAHRAADGGTSRARSPRSPR